MMLFSEYEIKRLTSPAQSISTDAVYRVTAATLGGAVTERSLTWKHWCGREVETARRSHPLTEQ